MERRMNREENTLPLLWSRQHMEIRGLWSLDGSQEELIRLCGALLKGGDQESFEETKMNAGSKLLLNFNITQGDVETLLQSFFGPLNSLLHGNDLIAVVLH